MFTLPRNTSLFLVLFQDILTGSAQVSLAGGTENMSAVPFLVRNARFGISLGANIPFEDSLTAASLDTFCNFTMPQTAENLAEKYDLKRGEVDQFALQSQQNWKAGKGHQTTSIRQTYFRQVSLNQFDLRHDIAMTSQSALEMCGGLRLFQ